jgi:DNA-binding MarR family transcriptional regulator
MDGIHTSFMIKRLQMQWAFLLEQEFRKLSMTNGQNAVLQTIARYDGESSAEIARRLHVKPQALNEFIPPFEQRGLIVRRGHPENRRILCVYLTPKGRQLLQRCTEAVEKVEAELCAALVPGEIETLRQIAFKLLETADNLAVQLDKTDAA